MTMDDTTLSKALARDVDGAFEALVLAHQDRLYTIALRFLGDPADAEEAAQDAFVRAHRALTGYPPERIRGLALRPWRATIVLNACRNRRRSLRDRRPPVSMTPLVEAGFDPSDWRPSPETIGDRHSEVVEWARRLADLSPRLRAAVVLRHVDGLSYAEIAEALGAPEGTVKAQVHRSLQQLRRVLESERIQPERAAGRTTDRTQRKELSA